MANTYKETMNLPKTDFAMRANLPESEPKRLAKWEEEHIYEQVLEKNKDGKPFILHDGPPYANGPIHIGHAFNKILKDFVNKSHAQRGFFTPYVPGWDCHGQPIEHMVEKTLGPDKMAKIDQPTLRRLCREWAEKYVDVQREGFKRLGVNADWEHPYLTFTRTTRRATSRCSSRCTSTARCTAAANPSTGASAATRRLPRPRSSTPTRRRRPSS